MPRLPHFTIKQSILSLFILLSLLYLNISTAISSKKKFVRKQGLYIYCNLSRRGKKMEGQTQKSYDAEVDNLKDTELRLGLPGSDEEPKKVKKRGLDESSMKAESAETAPVAKAQVVGWPPIRSYRKNSIQMAKKGGDQNNEKGGLFVKVSMDGAPYLRKVDLNMYKGYRELREGLDAMFKCFPTAKDEFAIAYEDKDSDLMLVGDVPWEMFITSCKKLRIMKGSEAIGLGSSP